MINVIAKVNVIYRASLLGKNLNKLVKNSLAICGQDFLYRNLKKKVIVEYEQNHHKRKISNKVFF